jgi:hypothetical protein
VGRLRAAHVAPSPPSFHLWPLWQAQRLPATALSPGCQPAVGGSPPGHKLNADAPYMSPQSGQRTKLSPRVDLAGTAAGQRSLAPSKQAGAQMRPFAKKHEGRVGALSRRWPRWRPHDRGKAQKKEPKDHAMRVLSILCSAGVRRGLSGHQGGSGNGKGRGEAAVRVGSKLSRLQ